MRKHLVASAVAAALVLPISVFAQETQTQQQRDQQRAEQRTDERRTDTVIRADRLIGQSVRDRQDDRVGRIDDLAVNLSEGKISYVVINRGGVWGIGGDDVAMQWQQIQPQPDRGIVRLDASRQDLERAQPIDRDRAWPADVTGTTGTARDERREAERREAEPTVGTERTATHNIVGMSRIIGMDVENQQGERLGQIDDVVISRDGKISYAVVSHGGFLGIGGEHVAIPWDRMNVDAQRERLTLDVTEEQLERARKFEYRGDRWPDRVDWPFTGGDQR
jgi:sporulation protein YlmC with PRC-barrel domain